MTIEWRTVSGWEAYEISEFGAVRRRISGGSPIAKAGLTKKASLRNGYLRVSLCRNGQLTDLSVHRLVLIAFIGDPLSPNLQACHIDGNRLNNHFSNLRWGTAADNCSDRERHGRQAHGERSTNAKLSSEQVKIIRKSTGLRYVDLAAMFGVGPTTIGRIRRRETWTHI